MPTFLIFKNGSVSSTIQGANPSALRSAVQAASTDAAKGAAKSAARTGPAFTSKGHKLGGEGTPSTMQTTWPSVNVGSWLNPNSSNVVIRFVGLYLTTLFSLDAEAAAAASPFAKRVR